MANELISAQDYDSVADKIIQLEALLSGITGEGFQHFKSLNERLQENYLFALSSCVNDMRDIFQLVSNDKMVG